MRKAFIVLLALVPFLALLFYTKPFLFKSYSFGEKIDSLNGVYVYYNGSVGNIKGRSVGENGYNIGLKYQCVEFVKRYYYEHYQHQMPNAFGNAIDFFDIHVEDGKINTKRNLVQYTNPSISKPQVGDLLIYNGTANNKFGHVAIVSKVSNFEIEIIQQNAGKLAPTRVNYNLVQSNNKWQIDNDRILGWLRK